MGGELLIESLSPTNKTPTYTELFWEAYPAYIAMGMSGDEYWNGDAQSCTAYRKAYEERLNMQDMYAWRQGLYVYHAMCAVAPYFNSIKPQKPQDYILPFSMKDKNKENEKETENAQIDNGLAYMKAFADRFNANFKGKSNG